MGWTVSRKSRQRKGWPRVCLRDLSRTSSAVLAARSFSSFMIARKCTLVFELGIFTRCLHAYRRSALVREELSESVVGQPRVELKLKQVLCHIPSVVGQLRCTDFDYSG